MDHLFSSFGDIGMNQSVWRAWCIVGYLLIPTHAVVADDAPHWNPAKTCVFVAGLLEWQHPEMFKPFPAAKINRRDEQLVHFFEHAGVPKDRISYLQDSAATKVRLVSEFGKFLDRTQAGDLLVFYFCGHGFRDRKTDETWFANYDAGEVNGSAWNVREIIAEIEQRFHGRQALLLADCCHSGSLYDEARKHHKSQIAYAVLTSSYSHNTSTGHWTFSDAVLAGLRGDATVDLDDDHRVTLAEVAKNSESELAFIEGQKSMFFSAEGFPANTVIGQARQPLKPYLGARIEVEYKGKWYKAKTIDADGTNRKVHYVNFDSSWDEWVGHERRRPYQPPQFATGDKVEVRWEVDKKWYPATVQDGWYGLHFVRYGGYTASADEWVGPDSIRLQGE